MTLDDLLQDMYNLEDEKRTYERKYGILTETFYEAYSRGEEPASPAWVRDWTAWASAHQVWLRRRDQYQIAIRELLEQTQTVAAAIERTARHEPIPVTA